MGQKVNPKIFRIGTLYGWTSKWISDKNYCKFLREDVLIKKYLRTELKEAGVGKVEIERSPNLITVIIHAAKPGLIIGRGGTGAEELKKKIKSNFLGPKANLNVNINEVDRPNLSAEVVLGQMIADIEKRIPYRRVMKQAISRVERAGALGVKAKMGGRLDGAEIARKETLTSGNLPLHTLRADIDYSRGTARTTYGAVGVKIWIYKGEVFGRADSQEAKKEKKSVPMSPASDRPRNRKPREQRNLKTEESKKPETKEPASAKASASDKSSADKSAVKQKTEKPKKK